MTWQELLNEGEKRLSKKGVPEAKLNAWYLFSDCFETSKSGFFLNQELETESEKTERFLALIAKRCERIPLEYLLGETEFMGLPFLVNENVLIPRQDTECLVEEVLKKCEEADVLDLCTGSGCIGITRFQTDQIVDTNNLQFRRIFNGNDTLVLRNIIRKRI